MTLHITLAHLRSIASIAAFAAPSTSPFADRGVLVQVEEAASVSATATNRFAAAILHLPLPAKQDAFSCVLNPKAVKSALAAARSLESSTAVILSDEGNITIDGETHTAEHIRGNFPPVHKLFGETDSSIPPFTISTELLALTDKVLLPREKANGHLRLWNVRATTTNRRLPVLVFTRSEELGSASIAVQTAETES